MRAGAFLFLDVATGDVTFPGVPLEPDAGFVGSKVRCDVATFRVGTGLANFIFTSALGPLKEASGPFTGLTIGTSFDFDVSPRPTGDEISFGTINWLAGRSI
jgi:hypothetical protein